MFRKRPQLSLFFKFCVMFLRRVHQYILNQQHYVQTAKTTANGSHHQQAIDQVHRNSLKVRVTIKVNIGCLQYTCNVCTNMCCIQDSCSSVYINKDRKHRTYENRRAQMKLHYQIGGLSMSFCVDYRTLIRFAWCTYLVSQHYNVCSKSFLGWLLRIVTNFAPFLINIGKKSLLNAYSVNT